MVRKVATGGSVVKSSNQGAPSTGRINITAKVSVASNGEWIGHFRLRNDQTLITELGIHSAMQSTQSLAESNDSGVNNAIKRRTLSTIDSPAYAIAYTVRHRHGRRDDLLLTTRQSEDSFVLFGKAAPMLSKSTRIGDHLAWSPDRSTKNGTSQTIALTSSFCQNQVSLIAISRQSPATT